MSPPSKKCPRVHLIKSSKYHSCYAHKNSEKKTPFIKSTHFVTVIILTSTPVPITRQSTNTPLSPLLFIFPTVIKQQKISTKQKNQLTERKGKKKGKKKEENKRAWHLALFVVVTASDSLGTFVFHLGIFSTHTFINSLFWVGLYFASSHCQIQKFEQF